MTYTLGYSLFILFSFIFLVSGDNYGIGNNKYSILTGDGRGDVYTYQKTNLDFIVSVAAGASSSFAVNQQGRVYSFGSVVGKRLGRTGKVYPEFIPGLFGIKKVFFQLFHGIALDENSELYGWADNSQHGELGIGFIQSNIPVPTKLPIQNITQVSIGYYFTLALNSSGFVYGFGSNANGKLGLGILNKNYLLPTLISTLKNIIQISTGEAHSLVLDKFGNVFGFGENKVGCLFPSGENNIHTPSLVTKNAISVQTGVYTSFIQKEDGFYAHGENGKGQLGLGDTAPISSPRKLIISNITKIFTATTSNFAKTISNQLYFFGYNQYGIAGDGTKNSKHWIPRLVFNETYTMAAYTHSLIVSKGVLHSAGINDDNQLARYLQSPTLLPNFTSISMGEDHSLAKSNEGDLFVVGSNFNGQCGYGSVSNIKSYQKLTSITNIHFISAGHEYSLVADESGYFYSFGNGASGKLGTGNTNIQKNPIKNALLNITSVAAGLLHSLVLNKNGEVFSFGHNGFGQLGLGDSSFRATPQKVENLNNIVKISVGNFFSIVLDSTGYLFGFGKNGMREIGRPIIPSSPFPTLVQNLSNVADFSTGFQHTIVRDYSGRVYGFGSNQEGQIDSSDNVTTLAKEIEYFSSKVVTQINVGKYASSVLDKTGEIFIFGEIPYLDHATGSKKPPVNLKLPGIKSLVSNYGEVLVFSTTKPKKVNLQCQQYFSNHTVVCNEKQRSMTICDCIPVRKYLNDCLSVFSSDLEKYQNETHCIDFIHPTEIISSETNVPFGYVFNTTITISNFASTGLKYHHQNSVFCFVNSTAIPTFRKSQNEYLCEMNSLRFGKQNISLYYVNDNAINSKVMISKYPAVINVQEPVLIDHISPHAISYSDSMNEFKIKMKLEKELNPEKFNCKYQSKGEVTQYTLMTFPSTDRKLVQCIIKKNYFSERISSVDVGLTINFLSSNYDITLNNATVYFIKPIEWNTTLLNTKTEKNILFFEIPTKQFNYSVQLMTKENVSLNCSFGIGSMKNTTCYFDIEIFNNSTINPLLLQFGLNITDSKSGEINTIPIRNSTFYRETDFQHLKPFFIRMKERLGSNIRVISNVFSLLQNHLFDFKCKVSQNGTSVKSAALFDIKEDEYEDNLEPQSHFGCSIKSTGNSNYTVQLLFVHEGIDVLLTPIGSSIVILNESLSISSDLSSYHGGYTVGPVSIPNFLPTKNYDDYKFVLKISDRGKYYSLESCNFNNSNIFCNQTDFSFKYLNWSQVVKKMKYELFVGSVRFISVYPFSLFYGLKIKKIIGSSNLLINTKYSLQYQLEQNINTFESIFVKYINHLSEVQIRQCSVISTDLIQCQTPFYSSPTSSQIYLSLKGNEYYHSSKYLIFIESNMTFDQIEPKYIYNPSQNSLSIYGENFSNSPIKLKYKNDYFVDVVQGIYMNSSFISSKFPRFYSSNIRYPLDVDVEISIDNGINFMKTNLSITLDNWKKISFLPWKNQENTPFSLILKNFPFIDRSVNISLVSKNNSITLNCNENNTICSSSIDSFLIIGEYFLNASYVKNNILNKIFVKSEPFVIFKSPTIYQIHPLNLFYENSRVKIEGAGFSDHKNAIIRFEKTNSLYFSNITFQDFIGVIKNDSIIELEIKSFPEDYQFVSIQLSLNDGFNFKEIKRIQLKKTPSLEFIENLDSPLHRDPTAYSFQDVNLVLHGKHFLNNKIISRVRNSGFTKIYHDQVNFTDVEKAIFKFPSFENISIGYNLSYPTIFKFGLSFNGGYSFTEQNLIYIDKFVFIIVYLVSPTLIQKSNETITVRGLGLRYAEKCIFRNEKLQVIQETNAISSGKDLITYCKLNKNTTVNQKKLFIEIRNQFNDTSNSAKIDVYNFPKILNLSRTSGPTGGGYSLGVFGEFDDFKLYCRFGTIPCNQLCERMNESFANCTVPPFQPGTYSFSLGHDRIHWISNSSLNFTFLPCEAGYESSNYTSTCKKCPPGKYKPTEGNYNCLSCYLSSYSDSFNATSCKSCPKNTKSDFGSDSVSKCLCDIGFYKNSVTNDERCLKCPIGGICDKINTSIPIEAQFGYWKENRDDVNFYLCKPEFSCGGGSPGNCTPGYVGTLCGNCDKGFYRTKGIYCFKCGNLFFNYVKLIVSGIIGSGAVFVLALISNNIMEYLMLISAIFTYFFSLLFFTNKFPNDTIKVLILICCIACVIICNVILVAMTVWDIYTRKKNSNKRKKRREKLGLDVVEKKFLEDGEFDFHYNFSESNVSSDEKENLSMNEIWNDLFSTRRIRRKIFLVDRKRKRISKKVSQIKIGKKVNELVEKIENQSNENENCVVNKSRDHVRIIKLEDEKMIEDIIAGTKTESKLNFTHSKKRNRFVDGIKKKQSKDSNK
eukprot:gene5984-9983_t